MEKEDKNQTASNDMKNTTKNKGGPPIWHSPAWITAIVGVVSVFFTVPEIIGTYLTKQQDIKLAQEKTEELRLGNIESKQEHEFKIVNNTLAQQGSERIFVLRYLAATLDDVDAKSWANNEVTRLDDLASRQEALDRTRNDFLVKEKSLLKSIESGSENTAELQEQLDHLRSELEVKKSEVSELQKNAGFAETKEPRAYTIFFIEKEANQSSKKNMLWIRTDTMGHGCTFKGNYCYRILKGKPPSEFKLEKHDEDIDGAIELFGGVSVSTFIDRDSLETSNKPDIFSRLFRDFIKTKEIPYSCRKVDRTIACTQQESGDDS